MNIRISIVFYFGIHVLVVKSNLIPNDGGDNSAPNFNKVNNDDPSSTSKANTLDVMKDEIWMARNRKFLNERNSKMTCKKMMKREITPVTSSQTVGRITEDTDTDFRAAVTEGKFVVDKTRFIPKLLKFKSRGQFIMLRPYRFGKSFFLSMLEAFFQGHEKLFCSSDRPKMDICASTDLTWEEYPILRLSFIELGVLSISAYIRKNVVDLAKKYRVDKNLPQNSKALIKQVFEAIYINEKKGVVVLVDEYDYPVMKKYFNDEDSSALKDNEIMIRAFFGAMKESASCIRFVFIVGATRVTPIGGRHNLLTDLTLQDEFSDMIGFTKEEILKSYDKRLSEIVRDRGLKNIEMFIESVLVPQYNSYRFTQSGVSVLNPLSVTMFLIENPKVAKPYWAETVKNRILLEHTVKKFSRAAFDLLSSRGKPLCEVNLEEELNRKNIMLGDENELAKILFQTGYMTIEKGLGSSSGCNLKVANDEVRDTLDDTLKEKVNASLSQKMEDMLEEREFEKFIEYLDEAMVNFMGAEYLKLESHYEKIVSFILENKALTRSDFRDAIVASTKMSQYPVIGAKKADYVKVFRKVTALFYFKRYNPTIDHRSGFNTTAEMMKCNSVYVKPYADKHTDREVMCIVIVLYAEANKAKVAKTDYKFIQDWAALEWFREKQTVKLYNLHPTLNEEQVKEVAAYSEMDQKKDPSPKPRIPVSELLARTAEIFKDEKLMSLEEFTQFIEECESPAKDALKAVKKLKNNDIDGVINLIGKCYKLVKDESLKGKFTRIVTALRPKNINSPKN